MMGNYANRLSQALARVEKIGPARRNFAQSTNARKGVAITSADVPRLPLVFPYQLILAVWLIFSLGQLTLDVPRWGPTHITLPRNAS